jgi:hypothetical protein
MLNMLGAKRVAEIQESLVWHYTINPRFLKILKCGYIDVSTKGVVPPQLPVVWFSANQWWEPTLMFCIENGPVLSLREMYLEWIFAIRIGVLPSSAPITWPSLRWRALIGEESANHLVAVAAKMGGSPSRWHCSMTPVPRSEWQAVESFDGQKWTPVTAFAPAQRELKTIVASRQATAGQSPTK